MDLGAAARAARMEGMRRRMLLPTERGRVGRDGLRYKCPGRRARPSGESRPRAGKTGWHRGKARP